MRDSDIMPFGKHKGEKLGDVPASYFLWAREQEGLRKLYPEVIGYVDQNVGVFEKEARADKFKKD